MMNYTVELTADEIRVILTALDVFTQEKRHDEPGQDYRDKVTAENTADYLETETGVKA